MLTLIAIFAVSCFIGQVIEAHQAEGVIRAELAARPIR